jgi:hypothetical protein
MLISSTHNLNVQATKNHSIVEVLAQAPCAMFSLRVLQSFPMQHKTLLTTIGSNDPLYDHLITFYIEYYVPSNSSPNYVSNSSFVMQNNHV